MRNAQIGKEEEEGNILGRENRMSKGVEVGRTLGLRRVGDYEGKRDMNKRMNKHKG